MGKTTGFLEYDRIDGPVRTEEDRIKDFKEFHDQEKSRFCDLSAPAFQPSLRRRRGGRAVRGDAHGPGLRA